MRLFGLVALLFTLGIAPTHAQSILYVDADAPDGGDGTSWTTAYTDLQDALAYARTNAGTVEQIWVADGTYYPVEAGGDPLVSFEMVDGVSLYGGFVGTETTLDERDLETHFSTLSGEATRPNHVVKAEHVTATLDGFKITGGWPRAENGGGLYVTRSTLTLRNLLITQNGSESTRYGGGLYMEMSTATIEQVQFIDNEASSRVDFRAAGSGAFILSSSVTFRDVVFEQNRNRYLTRAGGGLFVQDSQVDIFASLFLNNSIGTNELFNAPGGAIFSKNCILRINSTRFIGNSSRAGYDAYGGAIVHEVDTQTASSVILNSIFIGNWAGGDGGIGGAVYYKGTHATDPFFIVNSIFYDNTTGGYYSAVGGAVAAYGGRTFLINSALVGNAGNSQLGERESSAAAGDVTLYNAIVWANENTPFLALAQDTMAVYHAIVEDGYAGEKVIDADPLFVRMPSPGLDERWGTDDDDLGDFHLQEDSPAIDAGRTAWLPPDTFDLNENGDVTEPLPLDYEGNPRVQGLTVDIGPYESPFAPLGVPAGDEVLVRYDAYPNPARSFITLDLVLAEPTVATFTLYDVLGRRLQVLHETTLEPGLATVHLTDLNVAAGMYFVVIESDTMREIVPMTIVR